MNTERLVAGLDVGSAKTTAIIAEVEGNLPKHPSIKILGVGQAKTTGVPATCNNTSSDATIRTSLTRS